MLEAIAEAVKFSGNKNAQLFYSRDLLQKDEINVARKEGRQEGEKKGIKKTRIEIIKNMLALNMSKETISRATNLPITEIDKLLN